MWRNIIRSNKSKKKALVLHYTIEMRWVDVFYFGS